MALATVDRDGLPNVRMVLLKGFDERGFVFYTNQDSQKGQELADRAAAGAVFHWKSLKRQVRLRGPVEQVADAEADAYFATRARLVADRRLGEQAVGAARKPPRLREGGRARDRPLRDRHRCRARRSGSATASCRWSWSSGRTGRTGCTTASSSAATAPDGAWTKTRLYP